MHFSNQFKYNIHQLLLLARVHSPTGFLLLFFPCSFVSALYSKNIDELFCYKNQIFCIGKLFSDHIGELL
jgi:hypothetical protein